nr:hypothetical protein [Tanacetum cinerariifolium]
TSWEITKAVEYLKKEFEMEDPGKTKFCLGLQIEHLVGFVLIFRYLHGTKDVGLYYTNSSQRNLVGFVDAGYTSDPHTGWSQTGYVFTSSNNSISWRFVKQTMSATSSNHVEILAIREASRKCVIQHICESCRISSGHEAPTVLHEDNAAHIAQLRTGTSKIRSSDNLVDLFTKTLPTSTFKKLVYGIGMRRLTEAAIAFLVTLPSPKAIKATLVSLISLVLQPALFVVPFSAFQLLDIYWKKEHRLMCSGETCTASERDQYVWQVASKSGYQHLRNSSESIAAVNFDNLAFKTLYEHLAF